MPLTAASRRNALLRIISRRNRVRPVTQNSEKARFSQRLSTGKKMEGKKIRKAAFREFSPFDLPRFSHFSVPHFFVFVAA